MNKLVKAKQSLTKQTQIVKKVQVEVIEEQSWTNPEGFNPHPKQNLGQGRHQIILHNDPMTAAHIVLQILQQVFEKDQMESDFIMKEAHYRGQAVCFNAGREECESFLSKIEQMKMKAIIMGCPRIHIDALCFSIDGVLNNSLTQTMKMIA